MRAYFRNGAFQETLGNEAGRKQASSHHATISAQAARKFKSFAECGNLILEELPQDIRRHRKATGVANEQIRTHHNLFHLMHPNLSTPRSK